jgi:hypothetical protein
MMMMPLRTKMIFFAFSAFILGAPQASLAQTCNQTLSVGANIAAAVASAANGSTICLNSGDYGTVGLINISRTGFVTLRSTIGVGARMSPQVRDSNFIKFDSMTLTSMTIDDDSDGCSTNIHILHSTFVPNTPHLLFNYDQTGSACPGINMALVVDGNKFDGGRQHGFTGRISVRGVNGLTISNNTISNMPTVADNVDGIQLVGMATNVTIGPGNIFTGILQNSFCSGHCDAIQLYGAGSNIKITGNWFVNDSIFIMAPDGSSSVTLENNVFDSRGTSHAAKVQMGTAANSIQRHNTVIGTNIGCTSKPGNPASTNCLVENNILVDASVDFSYGSGCTGCTRRYNLFDSSGDASGSNNVIGTPRFLPGTYPALPPTSTTWAGWQLAAGSPGENAGNDGRDMGTLYYGAGGSPSPTPTPAAPTNVAIKR